MSYKALASAGILLAVGILTAWVKAQETFSAGSSVSVAAAANPETQETRSILVGPAAPGARRVEQPAERGSLLERLQRARQSAVNDPPVSRSSSASNPAIAGPALGGAAAETEPAPDENGTQATGASPAAGPALGLPSLARPEQTGTTSDTSSARRTSINPRARASRLDPRSQAGVLSASTGPALRVQTQGPKAVVVGKDAQYKVSLINDGTVAAEGVHVRIGLPGSVQVTRAETKAGPVQPQEDGSGQLRLLWSAERIPVGGEETIHLTLRPTDRSPFELAVDWTMRPTSASAQIEVQQPELKVAIFGPKDMLYGKTAVFTIQLTNPGTGDAEEVVLEFACGQQQMPAKRIGTIAAGEQTDVDVELSASEAGPLQVAAVASGSGGLRADAKQQVLVRRGRLEIEIGGPSVEYAGSVSTYRVRIANTGDAAASDVTASVTLPPGAKPLASGDQSQGATGQLSWRIGGLPPGAERLLQIQCTLTTAGVNRVEAQARGQDNLAAVEHFVTQVQALADLKLLVNDPPGPTAVGKHAGFEIRIINRGTKAAEQVNVVAQFSEGIEPVEAQGGTANIVPGQVLFRTIPRVEAGQEVVLKVVARADRDGNHRFRAQVSCSDPETRLVAEESTYFFRGDVPRTARKP